MNIQKSHEISSHLTRYAYIDSLRGLAVIGVLLAHVSHYSNIVYPSWLQILTAADVGPRGVQLFYVVSAFTLCLSFSNRKSMEKHVLRNFYIRRFFRIAPLFYLAILYYLWQQNYWSDNPQHFSLLNILSTFTFINGVSSDWINNVVFGGWSIAIEVTFYLLFPLLYYKLKSFRFALLTTVIVAIAMQLLRLYLLSFPAIHQSPDFQTYTFEFFPSQLPIFLIGMTTFLFMHEDISKEKKYQLKWYVVGGGLLLIAQALLPIKLIAGHYIYGIIFGILLFTLSKYPHKLLVNLVTVYMGKISFSLYLCHMAVYYWLTQLGLNHYLPINPYLNFGIRFILLTFLSSLIASMLYFTVEKGGIILGKKIINKHEKVTPKYISSTARTW
ncbi:MAG: acyltransferase family protein [Candidatus Levyibacteriota bacterium]